LLVVFLLVVFRPARRPVWDGLPTIEIESDAPMDAHHNSKPVTSLQGAASRRRMKPVLFVLGLSGLAAFAAVGIRHDLPASTASESSRGTAMSDAPATTPIEPSAAPAVLTIPERPGTGITAPATAVGGLLGVGDRLKVAFYERVDVEEDKWGRTSSSALRSIQQRPELSGDYTVQEDGTISLPMLGSIPIAGRSAEQVQAALVDSFEQLSGRKGLVNILSLERSPIYVLGPVKNAGSFKYAPGMTVLHALAVAGGLDRGASDPWQKVEAVREIQKRNGAVDTMLKLIARAVILKAERDKTEPKIPLRLLELVGATEAANLVNEQRDRRKAIAIARKNRESAILSALDSAKQDLIVYGRMDSLDELIKLRHERVNGMRALLDRNVISKTVLSQVQSELSDAEQRRQDANNQYANAKQRLTSLQTEALRVQADLRNDLEVEIEAVERAIVANEREFNTSEGVLSTLPATRAQFAKEADRVTYQVVRQTAAGPLSIKSTGMTVLQPGDLVNIIVGESESRAHPGSLIPISPASETVSVERTAKHQEIGRTGAD
jgi:exopolysaccharide production protein ExoF